MYNVEADDDENDFQHKAVSSLTVFGTTPLPQPQQLNPSNETQNIIAGRTQEYAHEERMTNITNYVSEVETVHVDHGRCNIQHIQLLTTIRRRYK